MRTAQAYNYKYIKSRNNDKNRQMKTILSLLIIVASALTIFAQSIPGVDQNIPFLVTCGSDSEDGGDDDNSQCIFVTIPENGPDEFFIRVYDPGCGGKHDIPSNAFNTQTRFEIFGGTGCLSSPAATETSPVGDYKAGTLLLEKTFENQAEFDDKYFSFGPIRKTVGEYDEDKGMYAFKIIIEARNGGNDCNLYSLFISTENSQNKPIEGCFAFMYEQCFVLPNNPDQVSYLYPAIPEGADYFLMNNFDFDNDGEITIFTTTGRKKSIKVSGDQEWIRDDFDIRDVEGPGSLEICITKSKERSFRNNIVVVNTRYKDVDNAQRYFTIPSFTRNKYD